ncbi:MAG: polyphenol oxidase family protein [Verrucomicrobiaceae bacterium]
MTFPALSAADGFSHVFTLRHPGIDVSVDRDEALQRLTSWHHEILHDELGILPAHLVTAEQIHGNRVAVVNGPRSGVEPATDGLICGRPGIALGIYVADCCAVYLIDPVSKAFGVVHSGKKGTEQNITGAAISLLAEEFAACPADLIVQLSPCIRPPAYEVDFAATICEQARTAGVKNGNIHDGGICTSSDLARFYSYRAEKGKTGRMVALIARKEGDDPETFHIAP